MWILFTSMLGLIDSVRAGFITTAFIRAYSGATAERAAEVVGSTWLIAILITGAFMLLNLVVYIFPIPVDNDGMALFLKWFSITFLFTLPGFIAGCVLQAELRFDKLLYLRLISQGLFVAGILVMMLTKQATLERLLYWNLTREGLTSLVSLVFGWTKVRQFRNRSTECAKELGHFGKYSIGSFIGSMLLRNSDTFIINFMIGPAALAVYNLAQRFMEIIEIPLRSSIATAIPALSAAFNQNDRGKLNHVLEKNAGVITWALVPIIVGMLIFADVLVYLLGGSKYTGTEAANILRIFLLIAIMFPIDRFFGVTLDVMNRPKMNLIKVFLTLFVSVLTNFIGIWLFKGIYGVAWASAPTILVGFLFGYYMLKREMPVSIPAILHTGFDEGKKLITDFVVKLRPARSY